LSSGRGIRSAAGFLEQETFLQPADHDTGPPLLRTFVRTAIFALHGKRDAPGKGADRPGTGYYHQKKRGVLNLKSGITVVRSGLLSVRPAGLTGPSIATILIPGNRRLIRAGEKVTIHLH
jgi:hypothetical protein